MVLNLNGRGGALCPTPGSSGKGTLSMPGSPLAYLHVEALVHGHVRPSNILAIEDQLKLASDGISSAAEHSEQSLLPAAEPQQGVSAASLRHASPYDPPEITKGIISPASDVWSLGLTVVEALTQHLPAPAGSVPQDPLVPDTLPPVYQDIARHCLHRDPQRRWTVVEIGTRLNPGSVPPSASAPQPVSPPAPAHIAAAVAPAILPAATHSPAPASLAAPKTEN